MLILCRPRFSITAHSPFAIFHALILTKLRTNRDASRKKSTEKNEASNPVSETIQGYCVKCKTQREMSNPEAIFTDNARPAVRGTCPECGTKMFRFGATALHDGMTPPEPKPRPKKKKSEKKASAKEKKKKKAEKAQKKAAASETPPPAPPARS